MHSSTSHLEHLRQETLQEMCCIHAVHRVACRLNSSVGNRCVLLGLVLLPVFPSPSCSSLLLQDMAEEAAGARAPTKQSRNRTRSFQQLNIETVPDRDERWLHPDESGLNRISSFTRFRHKAAFLHCPFLNLQITALKWRWCDANLFLFYTEMIRLIMQVIWNVCKPVKKVIVSFSIAKGRGTDVALVLLLLDIRPSAGLSCAALLDVVCVQLSKSIRSR